MNNITTGHPRIRWGDGCRGDESVSRWGVGGVGGCYPALLSLPLPPCNFHVTLLPFCFLLDSCLTSGSFQSRAHTTNGSPVGPSLQPKIHLKQNILYRIYIYNVMWSCRIWYLMHPRHPKKSSFHLETLPSTSHQYDFIGTEA